MDYEKAYKKALETARDFLDFYKDNPAQAQKFIDIFPELADSEDERIRKELIDFIQWAEDRGMTRYDYHQAKRPAVWIAYLEKQKDPFDEDEPDTRDVDDLQLLGFIYDLLASLEWSEDYAMSKDECLRRLNDYRPQKPAGSKEYSSPECGTTAGVWSEEDEKMLEHIISDLREFRDCETDEELLSDYEDEIVWLKSLRPQPQGTYKQVIHTIFGILKDKDFYEIQPSHRVSLLNDIRVKCKDAIECAPILDEPHWKPSEEQMDRLVSIVAALRKDDCDDMADFLAEIYHGLEKL